MLRNRQAAEAVACVIKVSVFAGLVDESSISWLTAEQDVFLQCFLIEVPHLRLQTRITFIVKNKNKTNCQTNEPHPLLRDLSCVYKWALPYTCEHYSITCTCRHYHHLACTCVQWPYLCLSELYISVEIFHLARMNSIHPLVYWYVPVTHTHTHTHIFRYCRLLLCPLFLGNDFYNTMTNSITFTLSYTTDLKSI